MNDVYKEQLVKVKQTSQTKMKKVGIIVLAIVIGAVALSLGGGFIGPIIIVGLFFGANYLFSSLNLEYEYILTNNELDVDKIMNKERRKRCFTVDLKEINVMAHIDDAMRAGEFGGAQKTIDISSGEKGADTYAILFNHGGTMTKLIFEPNESLRKEIHRQAPSKVFLAYR